MGALIGTTGWDPAGESMASIVERLARLNHLDRAGLQHVTGRSCWGISGRDPDDPKSLDSELLARLCGWAPEVFAASFPTFYLPPFAPPECWYLPFVREYFAPRATRFRVCPECALDGIHLVLHQFLDWVACPIHRVGLLDRCPLCMRPWPVYGYHPRATLEACGCGVVLASHPRVPDAGMERAKREIIDGYVRWMRRLDIASRTGYRGVRLLDRPTRLSTLAHLHALVPGPDWVGDCVVNAGRVRVHRTALPHPPWVFEHDPDEEARLERERHAFGSPASVQADDVLIARCQHRNVRRIAALDARLGDLYDSATRPAGPFVGKRVWYPVGHHLSEVPRRGLSCWRTILHPLLPGPGHPDDLAIDRLDHEAIQQHGFWQSWREGPGRLRRREPSLERQRERDEFVIGFGERWSEWMLTHLFVMCVARATVLPDVQLRPWSLPDAATDLGGMPVVALRRWRGRVVVAVATTLPPEQRIERLLRRRFLDAGANEPLTAETVADLHELVGIHPEIRARTARQLQERGRWDEPVRLAIAVGPRA